MKPLRIQDETPRDRVTIFDDAPGDTLPERPVIAYCRADKCIYVSDTTEWRKVQTEAK